METSDELETESCHLCGRPAAIVIDGKAWCEGCYHARGSCCAESEMEECEEEAETEKQENSH